MRDLWVLYLRTSNVNRHLDTYAFLWNDLHSLKNVGDEIHTYHQICDAGNDEKREKMMLDKENQQIVDAIPSIPGYDEHKIGCNTFSDLHIFMASTESRAFSCATTTTSN